MKLNPFRERALPAPEPEAKQPFVTPMPQRTVSEPPPRLWSLLLPSGFTNERT